MTRYETIMAKHFTCMFILGKRGNVVPVLMNPQQIRYLDYIVSHRSFNGIPDTNKYLFAFPNKRNHVDASVALRNFSKECGATNPSTIRGTYLRRQVATLSQLLVLDDNSVQELADYMGHTVEIHKEYYRRPELTQQVTKLARFFSVITSEDMGQYRGKSILELEPHIPEPDFDLDDINIEDVDDNDNSRNCNFTEGVSTVTEPVTSEGTNDFGEDMDNCGDAGGYISSVHSISGIINENSNCRTSLCTPPTPAYSPISIVNVENTPTKVINGGSRNRKSTKKKT